jgi:DNA-binding response OmpR family regulator
MRRRIVIADDDSTMINLITTRLSLALFDVIPAESGPEAVRLVRKSEPVAAILDVNMPGGNGLQALGALKADPVTASLPVMMLSGERDPDTVMNAMAAGADDYMVKPFNPERFLERVNKLAQGSGVRWGKSTPVWEI